MFKIAVIEKNTQVQNILKSYVENIVDVEIICFLDDLSELNSNTDEIDLVIFDITKADSDSILAQIQTIKEKNEKINFIAMSYEINSELVAKTLGAGICDFLLKPILKGILEAAIEKIKNSKNISYNPNRVISIYSPKGGVGKTTLAINLAYEISNNSDSVCLLDLNVNQGDICSYLDIEPKFDISYIFSKLETSNKELLLSLIPKYENLYILSNKSGSLKLSPNDTMRVINSLRNIFSYVIIDTTSIIDEATLSILNSSDLIMLIAIMGNISVNNCKNSIELFKEIGYNPNKIKLIINRFTENSDITLKDIETNLKKDVFFSVPNNYLTLLDALNIAQTVDKSNPQSNIAKAYKKLAQEIINKGFSDIDENDKYKFNHGIFNLIKKMGE